MTNGLLKGLSGTYVDDMLRSGERGFRDLAKSTSKKFDMAEDEKPPCTFTGFCITFDDKGEQLQLNQQAYVKKLKPLGVAATFSDFASLRMKLAWLSHSRPDVLFEVAQLAQVTFDLFKEERTAIIKRTNRTVIYAQHQSVVIKFPILDARHLRVIGYSDASFAMNPDLSSQLGYIVFIGDNSGKVIPIQFKSYKARRVVRSAMAAELIAFGDMFDVAYTLAEELRHLHPGLHVPVKLYTDSKSLFDVISKGSRTSEKRLMLDIAAARQGFNNFEISNIGFVRTADNIADGLTKAMNQMALRHVLTSAELRPRGEQWIVRDNPRSPLN